MRNFLEVLRIFTQYIAEGREGLTDSWESWFTVWSCIAIELNRLHHCLRFRDLTHAEDNSLVTKGQTHNSEARPVCSWVAIDWWIHINKPHFAFNVCQWFKEILFSIMNSCVSHWIISSCLGVTFGSSHDLRQIPQSPVHSTPAKVYWYMLHVQHTCAMTEF